LPDQATPPRPNGTINGVFKAVLVANNVRKMVRDAGAQFFSSALPCCCKAGHPSLTPATALPSALPPCHAAKMS
jgi:hypothetical protein